MTSAFMSVQSLESHLIIQIGSFAATWVVFAIGCYFIFGMVGKDITIATLGILGVCLLANLIIGAWGAITQSMALWKHISPNATTSVLTLIFAFMNLGNFAAFVVIICLISYALNNMKMM